MSDKFKYIVLDLETTGLLPWYGDRITCICAKDSDGDRFSEFAEKYPDQNEIDLIFNFLKWISERVIEEHYFISYNGKEFDIPFLMARFHVLDISGNIPDELPDFNDYLHFDLYQEIKTLTGKRLGLDTVAKLLGCTPKSGTGKNAIKLWKEGKYDELKEYCMQDVDTTEEVYLKWRELQERNQDTQN